MLRISILFTKWVKLIATAILYGNQFLFFYSDQSSLQTCDADEPCIINPAVVNRAGRAYEWYWVWCLIPEPCCEKIGPCYNTGTLTYANQISLSWKGTWRDTNKWTNSKYVYVIKSRPHSHFMETFIKSKYEHVSYHFLPNSEFSLDIQHTELYILNGHMIIKKRLEYSSFWCIHIKMW